MIDKMVDISRSDVGAACVMKGSFPKVEMYKDINTLLGKLSKEDRTLLAKQLIDSRVAAVFDVLSHLEWLRCCHGMQISIDNVKILLYKGQGLSDDYIGRLNGGKWLE